MLGVILALAASSVAAVLFLQQKPAPMALKFAVSQPENTSYPGMPSVSPDGRYLTFSAIGPEGKRMLWLRPLDALHATVIQGTEGASAPFWSPDSQSIAFFSGKSLKKVRTSGGAPRSHLRNGSRARRRRRGTGMASFCSRRDSPAAYTVWRRAAASRSRCSG